MSRRVVRMRGVRRWWYLAAVIAVLVEGGLAWAGDGRLNEGRKLYRAQCAFCHDTGVNDAPILTEKEGWAGRMAGGDALQEAHAAKGYIPAPSGGGTPGLTQAQVVAALDYMRGELRLLEADTGVDVVLGRDIYMFSCASCHDEGVQGAPVMGDGQAWTGRSPQPGAVVAGHTRHGYVRIPVGPKATNSDLSRADMMVAVEYMLSVSKPRTR
jgi:cytochrome c5